MNWNSQFATRTQYAKRSAVRELLKLTAQPDMISFAGGLPAPELFPVEKVRECFLNQISLFCQLKLRGFIKSERIFR